MIYDTTKHFKHNFETCCRAPLKKQLYAKYKYIYNYKFSWINMSKNLKNRMVSAKHLYQPKYNILRTQWLIKKQRF